jgi:hypothetical protein
VKEMEKPKDPLRFKKNRDLVYEAYGKFLNDQKLDWESYEYQMQVQDLWEDFLEKWLPENLKAQINVYMEHVGSFPHASFVRIMETWEKLYYGRMLED